MLFRWSLVMVSQKKLLMSVGFRVRIVLFILFYFLKSIDDCLMFTTAIIQVGEFVVENVNRVHKFIGMFV